jgi:hypothetical protein
MEESQKQALIFGYLNKYYYIENGIFLNKYGDQEWGYDIADELPKILSFGKEDCVETFKKWAEYRGVNYVDNRIAYGTRRLNVTWNPELAQDLAAFHSIDAEAELTAMLAEQVAQEIDAQILMDLRQLIQPAEMVSLIKCVGYEETAAEYDLETFRPRKGFQSMKKQDIEHERQNNTHWQDWVRARG